MLLHSRVKPVYLPEPDQHTVLRLALRRLDPRAWLVVDEDFAAFHDHKLSAGQAGVGKVYQALPGSEAAQQELHALVLDHLVQDHPDSFQPEGEEILCLPLSRCFPRRFESLWHTSLLVQEDLCILEPDGEETFRLTAASLCAPSNWLLEHKIGNTLDTIHGPVPGYQAVLAARVRRLFAGLKPGKPLLRFNWSVQSQPELLWRTEPGQMSDPTGAGDGRCWRVERQTLRRLPQTGAVVFGIRIFLHPFAGLVGPRGFEADLAGIIARLPIEQRSYKGLL